VKHANVVTTTDVVATNDEVLVVTDYVPGESAARLVAAAGKGLAPAVAAAIVIDVLTGLHAFHEATDESGAPLDVVHGALALSEIIVGVDGVARVLHASVGKAVDASRTAPELRRAQEATRATDVWGAGVLLAELLTGQREDDVTKPPSEKAGDAAKAYDEVVKRATSIDPAERYATAKEMATALEACAPPASRADVGALVESLAKDALAARATTLAEVEKAAVVAGPPSAPSVRSVGGARAKVVFGLVVPEHAVAQLAPKVDELAEWLGDEVSVDIIRRNAKSYESLARAVREGKVDLAWLPPIVYVRIIEGVTPLGSVLRGGSATYEAALVVRTDSKIEEVADLRGARAGWVDPWSAAGFVMPRLELASRGVDPRTLFRTERFVGSHRAAIEAVMEGACDVAGTFARPEKSDSTETSGGWSEVENADVRLLGRFGKIPPDVVAVRRNLLPSMHEKVLAALRAATKSDEARPLLKAVFGGEDLTEELDEGYEKLRLRLDGAIAHGLFD
jgi:phosphate/phosphite/phosphonate ABC transporter binding protein